MRRCSRSETSKRPRKWWASRPTQLLNWMKVPEFDAAYRQARRAAFQSMSRLQQGCWYRCLDAPEDHDRPEHASVHPRAGRRQRPGPRCQGDRNRGPGGSPRGVGAIGRPYNGTKYAL